MQISVLLSNTEVQQACLDFITKHGQTGTGGNVKFQHYDGTVSATVSLSLPTSSCESLKAASKVPSVTDEMSSQLELDLTSSETIPPPEFLADQAITTESLPTTLDVVSESSQKLDGESGQLEQVTKVTPPSKPEESKKPLSKSEESMLSEPEGNTKVQPSEDNLPLQQGAESTVQDLLEVASPESVQTPSSLATQSETVEDSLIVDSTKESPSEQPKTSSSVTSPTSELTEKKALSVESTTSESSKAQPKKLFDKEAMKTSPLFTS